MKPSQPAHPGANVTDNTRQPAHRRALCRFALVALIGLVTSLIALLPTRPATAQSGDISLSYVTPFPVGGTYKVLVIGDGFAEGAWLGVKDALKDNKKIELFREVTYGAGLIPRGRNNWLSKVDPLLNKRSYDIAVIMIGLSDRRRVKVDGHTFKISEDGWRLYYRRRVAEMLRKFSARKISTYWVGMPIVSGPKTRAALQTINSVAQSQTASDRVRYIDHWLHFANENGEYSQYGPDVDGKIRLLRRKDGIYFTRAGYEKLGYFINTFIQRDLRDARAERNVPLLGDSSDQKYLLRRNMLDNPKNRRLLAAKKQENETKPKAGDKFRALAGVDGGRNKYDSAQNSSIKLPPEKSRNGKETALTIIRPAIPAAAFAIGRRSSEIASENGPDNGPSILVEDSDDVIGFAISSATEGLTGTDSQRRIPLTQTPYYKLLVRGDSQPAKPGRADFFKWRKPLVPRAAVDDRKKGDELVN